MKRICTLAVLLAWGAASADTTLVFNEIAYTTAGRLRWVELYNQMAVALDVSGWSLDRQPFPAGTVVSGGGYLIVAGDADAQAELAAAGVTNVIGPLTNLAGRLVLRNNSGREMDAFDPDAVGRWPVHQPAPANFSWAKRDPETASGPAENWAFSEQAQGTPGAANFVIPGRTPPVALVALDSSWKADLSGNDLGAAWSQPQYDDGAWVSGAGLQNRPITTLFNTGVDANRNVLADGAADPHYLVTQAAQGSINIPATVSSANAAWVANGTSSKWISIVNNGAANVAGGTYAYRTTFSLDGYVMSTVRVNLLGSVDDSCTEVRLNGVTTSASFTGFAAFSGPFTLTSGFAAGLNTLDFVTSNGGVNPHAFRMELSGSGLARSTNAPLPAGRTTYYFRQPFLFSGDPAFTALQLNAIVSDGAVFYLNGVEVYRRNLPTGAISYNTPASNIVANPTATGFLPIPATSLQAGTNVLAVEVHLAAGNPGLPLLGAELQATRLPAPPVTLAFNELTGATNDTFWLELVNYGTNAMPLEGSSIHLQNSGTNFVFTNQPPLPPGGFLVLNYQQLGLPTNVANYRHLDNMDLTLWGPAANAIYDTAVIRKSQRGRHPDGTGAWLWPSAATAGASNQFSFHNEIVINEIMYHPPVVFDSNGLVTASASTWIELYNRSTNTVDLSGWTLDGGVSYYFPTGTLMAAGTYLVVANDAADLRARHPAATIVGNLDGNLSGKGERITLRDATQNPVNWVRYYDNGHWPEYADGGGSSLELRDPWADNSNPSAWAASDESAQTTWQTFTYRAIAGYPAGTQPTQWNDFVFGLLGAGECLIDDIRVIESPTNAPIDMITNGNFENGLTGWRVLGNHGRSRVITDPANPANHVLHLIATGPQEHMHNHVEMTYTGGRVVTDGRLYEITFRARWLAGNNLLNTRLYFNRVARTTILPRPANTGTPGAPNSRREANIGPTFNGFRHQPVIPSAGTPVTVTVAAQDPQGVTGCEVWWSVNGGPWANAAMIATNGLFTGTIPGQSAGAIVQFYTRATDGLGAAATWPPAGPDSGALYAVNDGQADFTRGHNFRIVLTPANRDLLHAFTNVMSNEELPGTVIYDEYRPYYDTRVRLKGSERGRYSDTRVSFHLAFQPDDLFRGVHPVMLLDRSGAGDSGSNKQLEIVIKHILQHAGNIPGLYSDLAKVIAPLSRHSSSVILSPRHEDEFIESAYQNGGDGDLYELELIYYPTTTNAFGYKNPNPDSVNTAVDIQDLGDDKELYRYNFIKKNHRDVDDYSRFITFAKAFSLGGTALDQATAQVMDLDEWLRAWALVTLCGVSDSYTFGNNHNLLMYRRPEDNKFIAFPVDMDFSFYRAANAALIGDKNFSKIINNNFANKRRFYAHVLDIIATTYNTTYMSAWVSHYNSLVPEQSYESVASSYIPTRIATVNAEIASAGGAAAFSVAGASTLVVGSNLVVFTGTAPVQAATIKVNGLDYPLTWTSMSAWSLRVPVLDATNTLQITGYDVNGQPLTNYTREIQVVYTNTIPSPQGTVGFSEIMFSPALPDAEYVELYNSSANYTFDLSGWRISGLDYTFAQGSYLPPRSPLVLAKNRDAYLAAYGASAPLFDTYNGNLQTNGETLTLLRPAPGSQPPAEEVVDRVRYEPFAPWPDRAASAGAALQVIDFNQDHSRVINWSDGTGWRFVAFSVTNLITNAVNVQIRVKSAGDIYLDDLRVEAGRVAGEGTNLLVNGDFESPLSTGWLLGSNVLASTLSTDVKHSGNSALHLIASARANTIASGVSQLPLPLEKSQVYTVSFWFLPSATLTNIDLYCGFSVYSNNIPTLQSSYARSPGALNPVAEALPTLPPIWLNEVQPQNLNGLADNFGERDPWVELYNSSTNPVSLEGWYLADNHTNLTQWPFPAGTVINPGQFLVVWTDGQPEQTAAGSLHTSFRLAPTSGQVALVMPLKGDPAVFDYLNYSGLPAGYSYGDYPDGQTAYRREFYWPSAGATNHAAPPPVQVFVNEWMADNISTIADPADGQHEDWFELYNAGTNAANLAGYWLGDRLTPITQIPEGYVIPPGGYLLVWADGSPNQNAPDQPDLHVNFRLSLNGERITFYAPDLTLLDSIQFGPQTNDVSQGRYPDGSTTIAFMPTPTPRQPNAPGIVVPSSNAPPVFGPLPPRQVLVGQTLSFNLTATDPDLPPQTLTFAFASAAPPNAVLTPQGLFTWTPAEPGTNVIQVRVQDNGSPALTAYGSFLVMVGARPRFAPSQLQVSGGQFRLQVEALDGLTYRLEYKNSLQDTLWQTLEAARQPTNGTILLTDPSTNRQRFYRVIQAP